jgi:VanZ family protein
MQQDMTLDATPVAPRHGRPALASVCAGVGLVALWAAMRLLQSADGVPPYLHSLFGGHQPSLAAGLFGAALLWLGAAPAAMAALLLRRPWVALGLPAWAASIGLVAWWLVNAATAPIDGNGGTVDWAHVGQYVATYGTASLVLIMASAVVAALSTMTWVEAPRCILSIALIGAPWLVLAAAVFLNATAMAWSAGMIRNEPWPGGIILMILALAVGMNAAALSHALRRPTGGRLLTAIIALAVLMPVGWFLANLALSPSVFVGGTVRSALQVLLGSELQSQVSESELFWRWCAAQAGVTLVLAWGHLTALLFLPERASEAADGTVAPRTPVRYSRHRTPDPVARVAAGVSAPGRLYLILAIAYGVFIVYGSLVPLEYKGKPFDVAQEQFLKTPYLLLHIQNRADLVANLLLYIPVTFFAMGAWTRENSRPGRWFMAACVTTAACGLAVAVEFLQIYFPPRTVSLNDILAECIGSGAGVAAWYLSGSRFTDWCRRLWRLRDRRRLATHIITGYAVALVLYQLYPYDVIISTKELAAEVRKIVFIPFADLDRLSFLAIGAKTAMMIPVGYLVAVVKPRLRLPVFHAALIGGVLALAIQALHLLIHSRGTSATDVVLGAIGAGLGAWAAGHFGPVAMRPVLWSPLARGIGWTVRLAAAVAGIAMMVWYKWAPFDFHWPKEGVLACALGWVRIPFFHQYWNTEFQATVQVGQDFGAPLILGILWMSVLRRLGKAGRVIAAVIAAGAGAAIEAGQLFFPPRVPDLTTVFIAIAGGILGVYLYDGLVWVFITTPSAKDEAPGPCSPT